MKAARLAVIVLGCLIAAPAARAQNLPELTEPVNDFAHVINADYAQAMDRTIRALQAATGDVVVVATIETFAPFGSLEEYANKLFENHGRGIGEKGKDNGVLITVAVKEHRAWIEVGYGLEEFITDGFAGETTRLYMIPEFRQNNYGAGLEAGVQRIVGRIAQGRNVTLEGVRRVEQPRPRTSARFPVGSLLFLILFILFPIISMLLRSTAGPRRWGRGPWSGWNSGIGPFGGGWGGGFGGFGGGGGGGGFGGFGGGGSGGGGGGGGW